MLDEKAAILIDVELPEPQALPPALVRLVSSLRVILVGWYAVPEQTSPEQAREQFEEEAHAALEEIADQFRSGDSEVDTHLVFTGDELDTIERISAEEDCDAILIPGPVDRLARILVPLRDLRNASRIANFVADLVQDGTTHVTLLHILEEGEEETFIKQDMLGQMAERMSKEGIDAGLVRMQLKYADDPADAVIDAAKAHDVVVLGETEPSVREVIFGNVPERMAREADLPVMIVRARGIDSNST